MKSTEAVKCKARAATKFWLGFGLALAFFVLLNTWQLLFWSLDGHPDTYRPRAGFPLRYLRGVEMSRVRPGLLLLNTAFCCWLSFRAGRWYRDRGEPDYVAGAKT